MLSENCIKKGRSTLSVCRQITWDVQSEVFSRGSREMARSVPSSLTLFRASRLCCPPAALNPSECYCLATIGEGDCYGTATVVRRLNTLQGIHSCLQCFGGTFGFPGLSVKTQESEAFGYGMPIPRVHLKEEAAGHAIIIILCPCMCSLACLPTLLHIGILTVAA